MTNHEILREIASGGWREKFARAIFRRAWDQQQEKEGGAFMEDWQMEMEWQEYLYQLAHNEPMVHMAQCSLEKAFNKGFDASEEKKCRYEAWEIYEKQLEEN